jgi:hypothetical protein
MIANEPFHDHRLALNIDRDFGASFEVEPLPHRLGNGDLSFRGNGGLGHNSSAFTKVKRIAARRKFSYGSKTASVLGLGQTAKVDFFVSSFVSTRFAHAFLAVARLLFSKVM